MGPRSVEDVRELEGQGRRLKFVYFWGNQPTRTGEVGASCMSQWWDERAERPSEWQGLNLLGVPPSAYRDRFRTADRALS